MTQRRALITGITGQDGSYLAEHLLSLGYEVHGTVRATTKDLSSTRIGHLVRGVGPHVTVHVTDMGDAHSMSRLIGRIEPHEVYNLAAQSHVKYSFDQPIHTGEVNGLGTVRILETIRDHNPSIRFYQASSSELFGSSPPPQSETTPFHPRSPYAVAKLYAYWSTVNYREAYGLHASNGILFNHESPRRGPEFVTKKIARAIPRILHGQQHKLLLGNLDVKRDWGHAQDYVRAMHLMLQMDVPTDLVIATGRAHSLRDFLDVAFGVVNLDWSSYVEIDPDLYRPAEVNFTLGDASKARGLLDWEPHIAFAELVQHMVHHELQQYGQL